MDLAIGDQVKQNRCRHSYDSTFVGRESKIVNMFVDENGTTHVKTEDGIWCPIDLLDKVEVAQPEKAANDYVLGHLQALAADAEQIAIKVNDLRDRLTNLIDEIEL